MTMPRASVILAAYRSADLLPRALERLRSVQPGDELEIVLVDDGSDDGSVDLMRAAARADKRIRVIAFPNNRGLGSARREGFRSAQGQWLWNVDVDDDWPPDALARMLAKTGPGIDLVLAAAVRRDPHGRDSVMAAPAGVETGREALSALLAGTVTGHLWNKLIHRDLITADVLTDARVHSDLTMAARILARSAGVAVEPLPVYTYISTPGSTIRSTRPRADSLVVAEAAVDAAVAESEPDIDMERALEAFRARFITLSLLRDAVRGAYDAADRDARWSTARSRVTMRSAALVLRRGWRRDAVLLALARFAPALFRRVMAR